MVATYAKLPYAVTDYSAGIQSVNQLRDNFQALHDAWAVEHSIKEPQIGRGGLLAFPPLSQSFGHHNTPKVPRAVVRTNLYTSSFSVVLPGASIVQPVVTTVARISTGLFLIGITELTEFYAEVEAYQSSATNIRIVHANSGFGGNGGNVGIVVECYEHASAGGSFDPTDFDFSAVIYGTN